MNLRWKIAAGLAVAGFAGAIMLLSQSTLRDLRKANPESALEPMLNGQPFIQAICNSRASTNLSLNELLTLKRVITTNDPDIATFELPISYDLVTSQRVYPVSLSLLVDGPPNGSDPLGAVQGCERAPNGDCFLVWNTDYDPPGKHSLQAQISYGWHSEEIKGPPTLFISSNICRFQLFYSTFDANGATLYAELPERNGLYSIELKSPSGFHIITLKGTTSNGVINVDWNLIDDHGRRYTNDSFDSVFNVTLPDSRRSRSEPTVLNGG